MAALAQLRAAPFGIARRRDLTGLDLALPKLWFGGALMFQFLRGIVPVAAMILNCSAVIAKEDLRSANYMVPGCRAFIAKGFTELQKQGFCGGTIDALVWSNLGVCAPEGVSLVEGVKVVVKYIDDRPQRQNENFKALALEALQTAWPCKN